ncbi:hypothetical protein CPB84DRAFT_1765163 [Gymnopilus junonius]|uniref:Uncharacterized protein n=1 Tax=Gymnopilus junonius TaxID=109634 RepID=A0A9P5NYG5_GYMJU|nr:hypothetical protein CPB84DRAFT_1765163 [Gymnopilus junonius]
MITYEFLSTFLATLRIWQAYRISGLQTGLMALIFREGILYFCSVSMATVAAFILLLMSEGSFFQRLLNALTLPMSGFLTARFLLHLRRWKARSTGEEDNFLEQQQMPLVTDDPVKDASSKSIVDEFGEDPVFRERKRQSFQCEA